MSIWEKEIKNHTVTSLEKDIEVDTLIIGASLTGLTCAYYLKELPSLCVVDASTYGHGVTLNTNAKVTYFQQKIYTQIISSSGKKQAISYLCSQKEAIQNLKQIIEKEKIDCDFCNTPSYVFANTKSEVEPLQKEYYFLKEQNVKIQKKDLPGKITSYLSYFVPDTYTFHPLKYLEGLYQILKKKQIPIYENTPILKIEKNNQKFICYSNRGVIQAKKIVFACHYPFFFLPFFLPIRSYIEKSYIVVSKVKENPNYSCISSNMPIYSTRFYDDGNDIFQICLAESHNTSFSQNDEEHFKRVKEIFGLEEKDIVDKYSNVDIMSMDNLPYIGKIENNMYIGTGYNTWGMTNSILAAKILSDLIIKGQNEYTDLFNPLRKNMAFFKKIPSHLFFQMKSYLGAKINKVKPWYHHVTFSKKDGRQIATYQDEKGKSHTVYTTCPHMGCGLIFNEKEKTWDCPCHSSRFDFNGKCIKGPSLLDITVKKS